jgi:hypothetical protein
MSIRVSRGLQRVPFLLRQRFLLSLGAGALATGLALSCRPHSSSLAGYLRIRSRGPLQLGCTRSISLFTSLFSSDQNCSMASLTPPQPAYLWNHSASDVTAAAKELIANDLQSLDKVGALPHRECNFDSVNPSVTFFAYSPF